MPIKSFVSCISKHLAALDNLKFITLQWSPLLVHIFEKHLDVELRGRCELTVGDKYDPRVSEFLSFLRSHVRAVEVRTGSQMVANYSDGIKKPSQKFKQFLRSQSHGFSMSKVLAATTVEPTYISCRLCAKSYVINKHKIFTDQSASERY